MDYQKAIVNLLNLVSINYETITIKNDLTKGCKCGCCNEYVISTEEKELIRSESIEDIIKFLENIEFIY